MVRAPVHVRGRGLARVLEDDCPYTGGGVGIFLASADISAEHPVGKKMKRKTGSYSGVKMREKWPALLEFLRTRG